MPQLLDNAVNQFSRLPGVGKKTALRLVLHMLRQSDEDVEGFVDALSTLKREVKYCRCCHNISDTDVCSICSDPRRDQDMSRLALESFEALTARFPDTPYAKDARVKIDLANNYLAGQEMQIGRYYLRRGVHAAALNRFLTVVEKYQATEQIQEALYRLTETYLSLGLTEEAQRAAAVLGYNYPSNAWYKKAYDLMNEKHEKIGAEPSEETPADK